MHFGVVTVTSTKSPGETPHASSEYKFHLQDNVFKNFIYLELYPLKFYLTFVKLCDFYWYKRFSCLFYCSCTFSRKVFYQLPFFLRWASYKKHFQIFNFFFISNKQSISWKHEQVLFYICFHYFMFFSLTVVLSVIQMCVC